MTRHTLPARRILIVEDDDDSRTLLGHLLSAHGYEVAVARNGLEGIRSARACHPDVILLDLQMPVMDGFTFRQHQLSDPAIAGAPVVCVSALDPTGPDLGRLGPVQFVRKPIDFEHLLVVIHSALVPPPVALVGAAAMQQ